MANIKMDAIRGKLALRSRLARWMITYRQGEAPNIGLFGLRRGGSTLLADMLSSERGMRKVEEPFFVLEVSPDYPIKRPWLDPRLHSVFFDLDEEDQQSVLRYMEALLAGELPLGSCQRPKFPLRTDRTLIKVLHATALLDWLAESFDLQVIRLLRHPAAQALSVVRAGWGFETEAYYLRPDFLRGFLSEEQFEAGRRILDGPSPWQKAIFDWCVHYRLLVHVSRWPAPLVTYEELMLDPAGTCRMLCDRLGLRDFDRIMARIRRPSTSPGGCSNHNLSLIESGDSRALVGTWQARVDAEMAGQAQEILDRFEVSIYGMSSPLPDHRGIGTEADRLESSPGEVRQGCCPAAR